MIEMHAALMMAPIDFDDETSDRRAEIRDVSTDDDLPAKCAAETAAAQLRPETRFRSRAMLAHALRAAGELMLALKRRTTLIR